METLDKHFRNLAKATFTRHGFASEQLISQWDAVVGLAFAGFCRPDKINWPKITSKNARKAGGTLVVRAARGRALELHYEIPRIMERVNQFLGYGAITSIKIMQGNFAPVPAKPAPRAPIKPEAIRAWAAEIEDIEDEELKAALARLAVHAAPNGPKAPLSTGENRDWSLPPTSSRKTS